MGCKVLILLAVVSLSSEIVSGATDKVVCYHGSWSVYRYGNGRFTVEDIDPTLCTHLIYSFVGIETNGHVKIMDSFLEINNRNLARFSSLKQKNPNLKTLVAIGGWNEGSLKYSNVAASKTSRTNLINSAVKLLQTYGYDGFDLDWEYPAQRGGAQVDKVNYVTLLKEFRAEFDKHGYLLTAAVAASSGSVDLSYDVPALSKYLDFINVMAYDLHGAYDGVTGQNAPLYPSPTVDISPHQKTLTVDASIRGWIQRGADPQKLVLGLGVYGRSFTLSNSNNRKLGAPASNSGNPGKYTSESGMLGYNEICELQKGGGWTVVWDNDQKVPYMSKGNQWVGYDNPRSIGIKVEYAKSLNLAGVMIWSIETEDFKGISGEKYPILNQIARSLGTSNGGSGSNGDEGSGSDPENNNPAKTTKKTTTTTTTQKPQGGNNDVVNPGGICTKEGYIRDKTDCNVFHYCLPYNGNFVPIRQLCNNGLYFDEETVSCNYPELVKC